MFDKRQRHETPMRWLEMDMENEDPTESEAFYLAFSSWEDPHE